MTSQGYDVWSVLEDSRRLRLDLQLSIQELCEAREKLGELKEPDKAEGRLPGERENQTDIERKNA
jgi:hypothetical protein